MPLLYSISCCIFITLGPNYLKYLLKMLCMAAEKLAKIARSNLYALRQYLSITQTSGMWILLRTGIPCGTSSYTHAHHMPHVEHVESRSDEMAKLEALSKRRRAVLRLSYSRVSEVSKSIGCWRASRFLSPSSCRFSFFCWAVNRVLYI